MKNSWMLDVLADLRRFADLNDLPRLSGELQRVAFVARDEFQKAEAPAAEGVVVYEGRGRTLPGSVVAGEDA